MKVVEKIFYKDYPCGSRMRISFVKIGGPVIAQDIIEDSEYKREIEENERLFYLKRFDGNTLELLKQNNFKECKELYASL